jgi:microsomal dipeptidase-like Zn-dependent dipeptidase
MKQLDHITLGEDAGAAIMAVEGLRLSPTYRRRIHALRSKGLSTDQIRETLIADLQTRKAA